MTARNASHRRDTREPVKFVAPGTRSPRDLAPWIVRAVQAAPDSNSRQLAAQLGVQSHHIRRAREATS